MNSELEILKKIWENNEEASLGLIVKRTGFGIDYARYICDILYAKEQLKPAKGKRGWYRVTSQGRKELERRDIIKPKLFRRESKVEKVTYYLPKQSSRKSQKSGLQKMGSKKIKKGKKIKDVDLKADEEKFNLGRSITKAVRAFSKFSSR